MSRYEPLISTKLHRPAPSADRVPRLHLVEFLSRERHRPLTLVSAPAGFGKTTLVGAWLDAIEWPFAWLSLDQADGDLPIFLAHLLAAVELTLPRSVPVTRALLAAPALPPVRALAGALANDLQALDQPFVQVLDDYHVIGESAVHELLDELLQRPPAALHLVLLTRHDPPFPLSRLRADGQLAELRAHDLRFTMAETAALAQSIVGVPLDAASVARVQKETEGWPAAVRLFALSLRPSADSAVDGTAPTAEPAGGSQFTMDYLLSEVLSRQPEAVQEFLVRTAVLDRLTAPLCDSLMRPGALSPPSESTLRQLAQMNLFVEQIGEGGQWYRYHGLFRQLLLHELGRRLSPAEIAGLYHRAGAWFAAQGYVDEALSAALAGGEVRSAVRIIAEHRHLAVWRGEWHRLDSWLRRLPASVVDEDADMLLCCAWLVLNRRRSAELPGILGRAEAVIAGISDADASSRLAGEAHVLRSQECYWEGDADGMMRHSREALALIPAEPWSVRLQAQQSLVTACRMQGDHAAAQRVIDDALAAGSANRREVQSHLLLMDGILAWMNADLLRAAESLAQVLSWRAELDWPEGISWSSYVLGSIHFHRNELAAAEDRLAGVYADRWRQPVWLGAQSAYALALTVDARGRPEEARAIADSVLVYLHDVGSSERLPVARAFQAELAVRQGRLAEARRWVDDSEPLVPYDMTHCFVPLLTPARVLLADGSPSALGKAADLLSSLGDHARAACNVRLLIEVRAIEAAVLNARGDQSGALSVLAEAVHLSEPGQFVRVFVDLGDRLGELLVRLAAQGVAPDYVQRLLAAVVEASPVVRQANQTALVEPLTERELEVLAGLGRRLSNKEIARQLVIAPETVKSHTLHIYQKLQVNGRNEAVAKAVALGILRER